MQQKRVQLVSIRMRVQSLAWLIGSGIQRCPELWRRLQTWLRSNDPMLLWLWRRPEAIALIQLLPWELPHATGVALKSQTNTKKSIANKACYYKIGPNLRKKLNMKNKEDELLICFIFSI